MICESTHSGVRPAYLYHYEMSATVRAPLEEVFVHMDDHARLSAHMSESSWLMGGGSMKVEFDAAQGQKIGSWVRLGGKILGVTLTVEEIVTERVPPFRKVWETTGVPRLLVIGEYRMGFEIGEHEAVSQLTVFIDYALPESPLTHWLGYLFGGYYARWCTRRMVGDTVRRFESNT